METGGDKAVKGVGQMLIFAAALKVLASALKILTSACKDFAEMSWEEISRGLTSVEGLLVEIGVLSNQ